VSGAAHSGAAPSQGAALYALLVLLLAYILSFVDRNVMAVLIGPIREDFAISDFQYSLLHGFAFSMFYIFLGLPIAHIADRVNQGLSTMLKSGALLEYLQTHPVTSAAFPLDKYKDSLKLSLENKNLSHETSRLGSEYWLALE